MLKLRGIFDKAAAILLGKHERYDDLGTGKQPIDLLLGQLEGRDILILNRFDTCHTHPLAIGKRLRVNTELRKDEFIEEWL